MTKKSKTYLPRTSFQFQNLSTSSFAYSKNHQISIFETSTPFWIVASSVAQCDCQLRNIFLLKNTLLDITLKLTWLDISYSYICSTPGQALMDSTPKAVDWIGTCQWNTSWTFLNDLTLSTAPTCQCNF